MLELEPTLSAFFKSDFDTIIDVRSPSEFLEDHVPGAVNLPVLDDQERARVGTIYTQDSPFKARKIGAALVFRNASSHIENSLSERDGGWRPLVYCWRGGQRSGSFTWMLREIGWRAEVLPGGYRTYRRLVTQFLYQKPLPHKLIQLGGYTGTAKTALLPHLKRRGLQIVDLEGLARHRGSLLGDMPGGQPSQKSFESKLAHAFNQLDPAKPVIVEAESSKIGRCMLPPTLWEAMKQAPWIEIEAPLEARAVYLSEAYTDVLADGARLMEKLDPLRRYRSNALIERWKQFVDAGQKIALCRSLAADHYDPAYDKSRTANARVLLASHHTPTLDEKSLDDLADKIAETVQTSEMMPA